MLLDLALLPEGQVAVIARVTLQQRHVVRQLQLFLCAGDDGPSIIHISDISRLICCNLLYAGLPLETGDTLVGMECDSPRLN